MFLSEPYPRAYHNTIFALVYVRTFLQPSKIKSCSKFHCEFTLENIRTDNCKQKFLHTYVLNTVYLENFNFGLISDLSVVEDFRKK